MGIFDLLGELFSVVTDTSVGEFLHHVEQNGDGGVGDFLNRYHNDTLEDDDWRKDLIEDPWEGRYLDGERIGPFHPQYDWASPYIPPEWMRWYRHRIRTGINDYSLADNA